MRETLLYFSVKYDGNWDKIYNALKTKELIDKKLYKWILYRYLKRNFITILDDNYPKILKDISFPPFVIYYKGNLNLLFNDKIIWLFGSKIISSDFAKINKFKSDLKRYKITIITGQSNVFENQFLNNSDFKEIIVVKDSGINSKIILGEKIEEKLIENNSLFISEFPDFSIPTKHQWFKTNKIKIGLSKGIFLYNTRKDIEIFNIISHVLLENKDIYCYLKSLLKDNLNFELLNHVGIEINSAGDFLKKWQKI